MLSPEAPGPEGCKFEEEEESESGVINFIAERLDYLELHSKVTVHRKNTKLITAGTSFHFSFSPLPLTDITLSFFSDHNIFIMICDKP